jgi:hypothetical protein
MIPHTLVLKPGLVVHSIYNGYWFWGRPSVSELWRDRRPAPALPGLTARPRTAGGEGARLGVAPARA